MLLSNSKESPACKAWGVSKAFRVFETSFVGRV